MSSNNLPSIKQLKQLAAACRKAGIAHFKSGDFEFTLGEVPHKETRNAAKNQKTQQEHDVDSIGTEELTPEELLMWSVGGIQVSTEGDA